MNRLAVLALGAAVCLCRNSSEAQALSADEREILWHQDQRSIGDSVLYRYLTHKDSRLRKRAAVALANIQDTSSIPSLVPLLRDRSASVRSAAAFALGQIGSSSPEFEMTERLRLESNPQVVARLLEALGKSGSILSHDDVASLGLPSQMNALKGEQALSIARYALREIKSERGVWFCFDALKEKDAATRWKSFYALWRTAPHGAIDVEIANRVDDLKGMTSDRSADVRMHFATLLGKLRSGESYELLDRLLQNELKKGRGDWRVQVNIAKALAAHAGRENAALDGLSSLLDILNDHVQLTVLSSLATVPRDAVRKFERAEKLRKQVQLLAGPSKRRTESVRGEALIALARHFTADFTSADMVDNLSVSNFLRSKALEALGQVLSPANLQVVLDKLEDDSVRVAMAAWDFLPRHLTPQNLRALRRDTSVAPLGGTLFRKIKVSLLREDMAITTLVAGAMRDSSLQAILKAEEFDGRALEELMLAFGKLSSPNDVEVMQAVLVTLGRIGDERTVPVLERAVADPDRTVALAASEAMKRITGQDWTEHVTPSTRPLYTDYDWKVLESIPLKLKAEVKTGRGTITIELQRDHAPFTVLSFYKLIRKKFFDGLTFHRVVPNFVIQGGDPRGDGWGGPNYALRSEFSLVGYDRGTVGVASAGKDTEGCQFFFTHSPQPHLDGRYTVFATVVSGHELIDRIHVGEKILTVRIKR